LPLQNCSSLTPAAKMTSNDFFGTQIKKEVQMHYYFYLNKRDESSMFKRKESTSRHPWTLSVHRWSNSVEKHHSNGKDSFSTEISMSSLKI